VKEIVQDFRLSHERDRHVLVILGDGDWIRSLHFANEPISLLLIQNVVQLDAEISAVSLLQKLVRWQRNLALEARRSLQRIHRRSKHVSKTAILLSNSIFSSNKQTKRTPHFFFFFFSKFFSRAMASSEFALLNAPSDGISRVRFAKSNKRFVVASSWDKSVRLFDVSANEMVAHQTFSAPVLDVVVSDNASSAFCGGLDKQLHSLDFATQKSVVMGQHEGAIRCVEQSNMGSIVTGGWDASCIVWDVRSNRQSGKTDLPGKALSMSVRDWRVLVGCGPSRIAVYDLRRFGPAMEARESPLKHQIRSVGCFPNNQVEMNVEGSCCCFFFFF
jgi:WD40 repeat protein